MGRRLDLVGKQFGRLTVVRLDPDKINSSGQRYWECRCSCGKVVVVCGVSLQHGRTKSCGCLQSEWVQQLSRTYLTKHSSTPKRLFHTWCSMKRRCYCKTGPDYKDYGARGITVCDEWLHDFSAFRTWALSAGYKHNLSIDRIDNDRGYSPENCRWSTFFVQSRNTRRNVFYTHPETGETLCAVDWSRKLGGNSGLVACRVKRGWAPDKAITTPVEAKYGNQSWWEAKRQARLD